MSVKLRAILVFSMLVSLTLNVSFLQLPALSQAPPPTATPSTDPGVKTVEKSIDNQVKDWQAQINNNGKAGQQKVDTDATTKFLNKLDQLTQPFNAAGQEEVITYYLAKLVGVISPREWCDLYEKFRGVKGKYANGKDPGWAGLDAWSKQNCQKPNAPGGGGGIKEKINYCPEGYPPIGDCLNAPNSPITATLIGDGLNTNSCTLRLTNSQTGATSEAVMKTVCASRKSLKPPQKEEVAKNLEYKIVPTDDQICQIVQYAQYLAATGAYDDLSIPPERRMQTVVQLAIWKHLGGSDSTSKDAITPGSIKKDLLDRAGVKESALSDDEKKDVDHRVDLIFDKVVLTEKPPEEVPQIPKKPEEPKTPGTPPPPVTEEPGKPKKPDEPKNPPGETFCVYECTTWHCTTEGYQDIDTIAPVVIQCAYGPATRTGDGTRRKDDFGGVPGIDLGGGTREKGPGRGNDYGGIRGNPAGTNGVNKEGNADIPMDITKKAPCSPVTITGKVALTPNNSSNFYKSNVNLHVSCGGTAAKNTQVRLTWTGTDSKGNKYTYDRVYETDASGDLKTNLPAQAGNTIPGTTITATATDSTGGTASASASFPGGTDPAADAKTQVFK